MVKSESMIHAIEGRLSAGTPVEQVAGELHLEVGTLRGAPAVILPGWVAVKAAGDATARYYPSAAYPAEAAERYVLDTGLATTPDWTEVHCHRRAVAVTHGHTIIGMADGTRLLVIVTSDQVRPSRWRWSL